MRGSPFLQAIFIVAAFALAGLPVYRLTRADARIPAAATDSTANAPAAKTAALEIEAVFAPAPASFEIKNLAETVLAGSGPAASFHARWAATAPPEGVDLVVRATWAGPVVGAERITVRFPDGREVQKSFWSSANGALTDVLTVPAAPIP